MTIRSTRLRSLLVCGWLLLPVNVENHLLAAPAQSSRPAALQGQDVRRQYLGDAACLPCHQQESASYTHTAHHLTSQPASASSILGSFTNGRNILTISEPDTGSDQAHLYFSMEQKPDGFYETAVAESGSRKLTRSERMDVVVGSGVRGQTYLYWSGRTMGDQLFELPVSYWTEGAQWINSPGYRDGTANFARRADPRCMECHATYIKALSPDPQMNRYDRGSLVMGISCETCHGPGAEHVARERSGTARSRERKEALVDLAKLDRGRQIDQCAVCHNGTDRKELGGAFTYVPGQPMDRYFAPARSQEPATPDVHGNQVGLLEKSRCFLSSPKMTCTTCHDVHAPERAAAAYSPKCLSCHAWQRCGESKTLGHEIARDCIGCHMPLEQTNAIVSVTAGRVLRTSIRTHWIKVYPKAELPGAHLE